MAWDSLTLRFFKRGNPDALRPHGDEVHLAAGRGDTARVEALLADPKRRRELDANDARELARGLSEVDLAERVARLALDASTSRASRANGHLVMAELAIGQGRWKAARENIGLAAQQDPLRARLFLGAAATLPFARWPRADLENVERELVAWDATAPFGTASPSPTALLLPHIRLYLLGLLRSQMSDWSGATARAAEIEATAVPGWLTPVRDALARTVRADIAWRQGRPREAVTLLEPVRGEVPLDVLPSGNIPRLGDHILSQEHARFIRGDALLQLGENDEAARWLGPSFILAPGEFIYRAPLALRLAEMHDRAGRHDLAVTHYSRFVRLWNGADGELTELVAAARRRIAELAG